MKIYIELYINVPDGNHEHLSEELHKELPTLKKGLKKMGANKLFHMVQYDVRKGPFFKGNEALLEMLEKETPGGNL